MTEKQLDVKLAEFNVKALTLRVREAFVELQEGTKAIQAKANSRIENLRVNYESAVLDLNEAELHLVVAKEKAERSFD